MVLAYAAVKRYPDQIYSTIRCAGFAATRACAPARKRVSGAPCIRDASRGGGCLFSRADIVISMDIVCAQTVSHMFMPIGNSAMLPHHRPHEWPSLGYVEDAGHSYRHNV